MLMSISKDVFEVNTSSVINAYKIILKGLDESEICCLHIKNIQHLTVI